ncbi:hypothetical protein BH10ACI1_BH10ACI1_24770 [soil metagenome]
MRKFSEISFVLFILFVFSLPSFGQSVENIEQELIGHIKNIREWSNYTNNYQAELAEKLDKENKTFKKKLLKYANRKATLKYDFKTLGEYMNVATSKDGKFRIYSWDEENGGTMRDYAVVYQYQGANGKVYSRIDKEAETDGGNIGAFVYNIYSVKTKAGKVYVVCSTFIGGNSDHYGSANLYKIKGSKLIDTIKLFKTKSGLQNSIGFEYNFFSVVDRPERPIKLVLFNEKKQTVKIPVVIKKDENDYGTVTNKFINYRFNGTYFVKLK